MPALDSSVTSPGRWGLFGTLCWSLLVGALFIVVQTVSALVYVAFAARHSSKFDFGEDLSRIQYDGDALSVATFVSALVCVPAVLAIIKLKRGATLGDYLPLSVPPRAVLLGWLGFTVAFIVFCDALSFVLDRPVVPEFMEKVYASSNSKPALWAALLIGAPLFEEVFFRGFMVAGLIRSRIGVPGAVLASSLAWAALHVQYDLFDLSFVFLFGVMLAVARWRTGSLVTTLAMHFAWNAEATLETALVIGGAIS